MSATDYKTKTVMVVDDETSMRMIIRKILEQLGVGTVLTAKDGQEALTKLQTQPIDCILLDWNLPKISGIDLLKTIRADHAIASLPVVMVTAEASEKNIREAMAAKVSAYMVKPITQELVEKKLSLVFEQHACSPVLS